MKPWGTLHGMVTTAEVLTEIGKRGIIVGSWPRKGDDAKDLDVVIRPAQWGERNPVFCDLLERWRETCDSEIVGHLVVWADPVPVEVFDGAQAKYLGLDEDKAKGVMTFRSALLKAVEIEAHGVPMKAVV